MRNRVLGQEHPDTLEIINSFALAYSRQGRLTEAEKLHAEVLKSRQSFGRKSSRYFEEHEQPCDSILGAEEVG